MLFHCLKCRENTEPKIPRVSKTNTGKSMLLSKDALCHSKKCYGLLSNLQLKHTFK